MTEQQSNQDNRPEPAAQPLSRHARGAIRRDPFIRAFLEKTPKDVADSFTDAQLLQLKLRFGTRAKARHVIDFRTMLGGFGWNYYLVFLFGRNRRELTRPEQKAAFAGRIIALLLGGFLLFSVVITSLYLVKSFAGIDLLPNFSFGLWHWLGS
ncbi:hypothetical protein AL542_05490 [Grimontia hollisae]|uniref:3-phosphoshikimate 1-carboxyvinyltransferase n=2 Tax=Grimontia hollisae TaxID=673 RepID=D0ICB7_GRIHO|nr:hypothetical protein [Grimontia hollisae]AMG29910.1 hypothetical protein AL542_05490 [Grimontia hollisae]EEY71535.1 hypothetical protein VHA_003396 [Grimontia hollisae CIP 101886]MDF2185574.1 hypothetical protein [Grimontia hollisae]STO43076.1 Uncharacterised protein [Grimontia hollisae]STO56789.1 Uncharacterised protein [Grimontia hollisae]